jgi:hypothetical protein
LELGKTREQKNRDSHLRRAFSVGLPTMHKGTPIQNEEKPVHLCCATTPLTRNGKGVDLQVRRQSGGHLELPGEVVGAEMGDRG